jgi:hypothetical protein
MARKIRSALTVTEPTRFAAAVNSSAVVMNRTDVPTPAACPMYDSNQSGHMLPWYVVALIVGGNSSDAGLVATCASRREAVARSLIAAELESCRHASFVGVSGNAKRVVAATKQNRYT